MRGNTRPVQKRDINLRANIHNRFDIEVLDAETGELKQKAQAFNLICDVFWTRLFRTYTTSGVTHWAPERPFRSILFGSGTGTPAAADTTLFNQLGYRYVGGSNEPAIARSANERTGIYTLQAVGTLEASDNVGDTITEVGIGYDTTHCVTHAMLQDMNGNPISITKTATDVIKIYATFFVHWPDGGWYNGSVMFKAGYYRTYTDNDTDLHYSLIYLMLAGSSNSAITLKRSTVARCTGVPESGIGGVLPFTINASAKTATVSTRFDADKANRPIRAIELFAGYGTAPSESTLVPCLQVLFGSWFSPPTITGEADGTGDGSATGFNTAFPVKTVGTVYVDGVAAPGATMRTGPSDGTMMQQWFNQLISSDASAITVSGKPLYWAYRSNGSYVDSTGIIITSTLTKDASTRAFENPYSALGISKFMVSSSSTNSRVLKAQASDDLATWTDCGTVTTNGSTARELAVDSACQNKRYFRFINTSSGSENFWIEKAYAAVADPEHNISFATPPAAGAVITCDYTPDCVAKDENHVFDLNIVLTFGEYVEE